MVESLHVIDLYFPPELSILKLPFFMKHPVEHACRCRSPVLTDYQQLGDTEPPNFPSSAPTFSRAGGHLEQDSDRSRRRPDA